MWKITSCPRAEYESTFSVRYALVALSWEEFSAPWTSRPFASACETKLQDVRGLSSTFGAHYLVPFVFAWGRDDPGKP